MNSNSVFFMCFAIASFVILFVIGSVIDNYKDKKNAAVVDQYSNHHHNSGATQLMIGIWFVAIIFGCFFTF